MDQSILMFTALPAALVGFAAISTQRTKYGMLRRAATFLLLLILIPSILTLVSYVFEEHVFLSAATTPKQVQEQLIKNIGVAVLFFCATWLFSYLMFFRKSLEDAEDM